MGEKETPFNEGARVMEVIKDWEAKLAVGKSIPFTHTTEADCQLIIKYAPEGNELRVQAESMLRVIGENKERSRREETQRTQGAHIHPRTKARLAAEQRKRLDEARRDIDDAGYTQTVEEEVYPEMAIDATEMPTHQIKKPSPPKEEKGLRAWWRRRFTKE